MTDKEFKDKLRENKWFDDPEELISYRLPVLQYYVHNFKMNMIINGVKLDFSKIDVLKPENDSSFCLMNQAFDSLVNRLKANQL